MTFRGSEKMDEGAKTKDHFAAPTGDSTTSFVGLIQSKHGHQSTSTPYVGAYQASGCVNLKRNYDSGCDPTLGWDTPIAKAPHTMTYCDHWSLDTLKDTEACVSGPHPQLNLLPCFEERAEELPTMRAADPSVWRERHLTQKRHSLEMDKSPSPYRSYKRHSLDLSSDSGCFSTQTARSDSHFSGDILENIFDIFGECPRPPLLMVCTARQDSLHNSTTSQSFGEKYFASGLETCDSSGRSSDSFRSNLTPTIGEKVSKLQLALTRDSGCSVTSLDASCEPSRNVHSNSTPSFGKKPFELQPVLPSDCVSSKVASGQSAHDFPLSFGERVSKSQSIFPDDSTGISVSSTAIDEKSTSDTNSKSTLLFTETVSKLQSSDLGHGSGKIDLGECSTRSSPSESSPSLTDFSDSPSIVMRNSHCKFDSTDTSQKSESFLESAESTQLNFLTGVEETRLEMPHRSRLDCGVVQNMKRPQNQTFEERLAARKMRLDQEIGLRMGKRYVDIIRELGRKMFTEPLAKVFGYLSEEELCSLCLVSRHWKSAVECEPNARLRRRRYVEENRERMAETPQENRSKTMNPFRVQVFTNPNKPMAEIQTVEELPTSRPVAPMPLTKAEEFFKEARSLDRNESLRKCPGCESPARANDVDHRAKCTKCEYEFCLFCRKPFHGRSECVKFVRYPAPTKIGSKKSKQNLRRL